MNGERRSHKMSEENWAAIDSIAQDLNITAKSGSRVGLPSWRSLLYQVATGKLVVTPAITLDGHAAMIGSMAKAINRLEVKPRSHGAKRRILARLRAMDANG